ncbi:MAG: hypothetical protein EP297_00095 [Gammaproteobacteria bacterium]|nr:MAG: hypothetical protein EP297_00095 [Gammaproteobacteria bacterium]
MNRTKSVCVFFTTALLWPVITLASENEIPPQGSFSQAECIECHSQLSPEMIDQWRDGPHAETECLACHGNKHGVLPGARRNTTCMNCHTGEVEHSYASSKHGVIFTLEEDSWDWTLPLERANYRVPGCAYCHLHDGDHGDTMEASRGQHVRDVVCVGCHAPRYVTDQFTIGAELIEIGHLKAREATAIATRHPQGPGAVENLLESVQRHLRNVRLGVGHQSPDYQWWLGQPALDGDLIRLRDAVAKAKRWAFFREQNNGSRPGTVQEQQKNEPGKP